MIHRVFQRKEMLLLGAVESMHGSRKELAQELRLSISRELLTHQQCFYHVQKLANMSPKVNPRSNLQTDTTVDSIRLTVPSVRFALWCKFQWEISRKRLGILGREITQEIPSILKMP